MMGDKCKILPITRWKLIFWNKADEQDEKSNQGSSDHVSNSGGPGDDRDVGVVQDDQGVVSRDELIEIFKHARLRDKIMVNPCDDWVERGFKSGFNHGAIWALSKGKK